MGYGNTSEDGLLRAQLQGLINAIAASGGTILPGSNRELLRSIVQAAAKIFGAAGASIALIDERSRELEFVVAYNPIDPEDQKIIGMRIPVNKGIAGYVAVTGQPIAIANVQEDARFNLDFAAQTGYVPRSILAMPLISQDTVIGVMEVLDKMGAASFNMQDMDLLSIFTEQAALAIHQSQQIENLQAALVEGLKRLLPKESYLLGETLESQPPIEEDILLMVELIKEIGEIGDSERQACIDILKVFRRYSHSRSSTFSEFTSFFDER